MTRLLSLAEAFPVTLSSDGNYYRRLGYCGRCGECCKSGNPYTGIAGEHCPHYSETRGVGHCNDHTGALVANACAHWPSLPEHISAYPSCTYRFEVAEA